MQFCHRLSLGLCGLVFLGFGSYGWATERAPTHTADDITEIRGWVAQQNSGQLAPVGETPLTQLQAFMPPPQWREFQQQGIASVLVTTTGNYMPPRWYRDATEHNTQVTIGDGQLNNYAAGLPFPNLTAKDPRLAKKLMWNIDRRFQHRGPYVKGNNVVNLSHGSGALSEWISPTGLTHIFGADAVGRVDRFYRMDFGFLYFDRIENGQPSEFDWLAWFHYFYPNEMNNLSVIQHRFWNQNLGAEDTYTYLPEARRIRRAQTPKDDPFLGGEFDTRDFWGFFDFIPNYTAEYWGQVRVLAVMNSRYPIARFTGTRGTIPDDWYEPRPAYAVLLTPVNPDETEDYGARVLFIDSQTWGVVSGVIFDTAGQVLKLFTPTYKWHEFPGETLGSGGVCWFSGMSQINVPRKSATLVFMEEVHFPDNTPERMRGVSSNGTKYALQRIFVRMLLTPLQQHSFPWMHIPSKKRQDIL